MIESVLGCRLRLLNCSVYNDVLNTIFNILHLGPDLPQITSKHALIQNHNLLTVR